MLQRPDICDGYITDDVYLEDAGNTAGRVPMATATLVPGFAALPPSDALFFALFFLLPIAPSLAPKNGVAVVVQQVPPRQRCVVTLQ